MSNENMLALNAGTLVSRRNLSDIRGFFSKTVEIPQGVRVLAFENGRNIGEVPPGNYTLESFSDKLKFWTRKDTVLYLFQSTPISATYPPQKFLTKDNHGDGGQLDVGESAYASQKFLTKDNLLVSSAVEVQFRISDMGLFVKNMLGGKMDYTNEELVNDTSSIMLDSLQESFSQFTIAELNGPEARKYLDASVELAIQSSMGRYGIAFERLSILSMVHEGYDELQEKKRELWLIREDQPVTLEENELKNAARLNEVRQQEKWNELDLLAEQVGLDREEGELAVTRRRAGIHMEERDLIQSDQFDEITTENEMKQFLFENDKNGLLREQERRELIETFAAEHSDKAKRREKMLEKLDMQLQNDLNDYRLEYEHGLKLLTLQRESEIAQRTESEENRKWLVELERERAQRKENIARLADEQLMVRAAGEVEFERLQSEKRNQAISSEIRAAEAASLLDQQNQRELWEIELRSKKSESQLDRLAAVQKLNQAQDLFDLEIRERKDRLDSELRVNERTIEQKFELDKLRIYTTFGPEGILTLLGPEQAKAFALARSGQADKGIAEALLEQERKNSDKTQELLREILAAKDRDADRLVQMHTGTPQSPTMIVSDSGVQTIGPNGAAAGRKLLCPKCRAEVVETAKFCPNCGAQL